MLGVVEMRKIVLVFWAWSFGAGGGGRMVSFSGRNVEFEGSWCCVFFILGFIKLFFVRSLIFGRFCYRFCRGM